MASVYIHIVKSNGKKYIGQCSGNPQDRWGHKGHRYKGQRFYRAIVKYGWDNMIHNVIATNLTQEEVDRLEKFYIERYKADDENYKINTRRHSYGVKCVETGETWATVAACAEALGVKTSAVNKYCRGACKSSTGLTFIHCVV